MNGSTTTYSTRKWAKNYRGEAAISEVYLQLLHKHFLGVKEFFQRGPDGLWEAVWGEIDHLITLHIPGANGPFWLDAIRVFCLHQEEFYAELQRRLDFGEDFDCSHLSKAIAYFRLAEHFSEYAFTLTTEAYMNIYLCLLHPDIEFILSKQFNVLEEVRLAVEIFH